MFLQDDSQVILPQILAHQTDRVLAVFELAKVYYSCDDQHIGFILISWRCTFINYSLIAAINL